VNKAFVYSAKGIKSGSMSLPKDFSEKENMTLLAQALRVYISNEHPGLSKVKTRAEVDLTKRKVYRQKGTGGARHGAKSAPIFVGGGIAHGPKGIKRKLTLSKKLIRKALYIALSLKAKEGKIVVVRGLDSLKKTKETQGLIDKIKKETNENPSKEKTRVTFALSGLSPQVERNIRNIRGVNILPYKNLNAFSVYFGGVLILDSEVFVKSPKPQKAEVKPQLPQEKKTLKAVKKGVKK